MKKPRPIMLRMAAISLLVPILGLFVLTPALATSSSSSVTFNPVADAYVNSSYPDTNYGTGTTLRVDGSPDVHSYLRFTVSGLNGATITGAQLQIYANSASSSGLTAWTVADNTWGETTITYNNAPALGTNLNTSPAVVSGTWVTTDVSAYIKAEGTYSFGVTTPGGTAISLASRESGANAPRLILTLGSSSTSTPTNTLAATATPTGASTATATPTAAASPTPTSISGGTATFTPNADSYVNSSYPSTNYGTSTTLRVDGSPDVHSYLRFTVSGLNGATITGAQLQIYANSASSSGLTAWTVADNTWGETTITYNNAPALGTNLNTSPAVVSGTWVTTDVSAYIKAEGTYSFGVTTPGGTAISLASRESGANAPKLVLSLGGSGSTATPTPTASSGSIQHVFLILMENKSYNEVWNTSSSPYITQLGKSYSRATNYFAITHPSLPNYLDIFGGSNYSITTDCSPSSSCHINASSLGDTIEAKGLTWKAYEESMPSPCYLTTSGNYAPKHNPPVYFDDIRTNTTRCDSHDVVYTALATDLASASTTPNFSFITPDLCNDMHNCSISTGDTWLSNNVPPILNSPACTVDKCLVVLTWDEDDSSQSNQVLTIFAGSAAKTGGATTAVHYNHFSLLRTVESIFGLPTLTSNDAAASPMTDLLR